MQKQWKMPFPPEYALSLNINKLRGINKTENGWWLSNHLLVSISTASLSESVSSVVFFIVFAHTLNLEWGVKFITTGDPRDRIATTGK